MWQDFGTENTSVFSLRAVFDSINLPVNFTRYTDEEKAKQATTIQLYNENDEELYYQHGIKLMDGTNKTETGKKTMIRKVSDFLWYSLDSWGREHANDD